MSPHHTMAMELKPSFGLLPDHAGEMQGFLECDLTLNPTCDPSSSAGEYKGLRSLQVLRDSAKANMERYNAEEAAKHLVNSPTFCIPVKMNAVYSELVQAKIVDSTATAQDAMDYLRANLPSSVVVEACDSFEESLTFLNIDILGHWLASSNAYSRVDIVDNDSEHSWDSWTSNTVSTNIDDFYGSPTTEVLDKPSSVRKQLSDAIFRMSSQQGAIDTLIAEFETAMAVQSGIENKKCTAAIRRTTPPHFVKICPHNDPKECHNSGQLECRDKLHLERVVTANTDESLGDCNYLDTCFKGRGCRYVHYRVQLPANRTMMVSALSPPKSPAPQWIQCNLQQVDLTKMGSDYGVIIADPPWDIHLNTSRSNGNTLHDDDIAKLGVECLQSEGIIFLWVTGRALDAGRACLKKWGYKHAEELIWLKINQLGRTIGTGRTGHWLNHTKEHVLVGVKGNPEWLNKQLDVDTLVSMSRGNSKKPEELYSIVERLAGSSTRKLELFGRENNLRPGWLTMGSELAGTQLNDPLLKFRWARASKRDK